MREEGGRKEGRKEGRGGGIEEGGRKDEKRLLHQGQLLNIE